MSPADTLTRFAELERMYDGPIPPPLLETARHGSRLAAALFYAAGRRGFYAEAVRSQVRIIRRRRADGSFYPALLTDLAYYRGEFRRSSRRHRALASLVENPITGAT